MKENPDRSRLNIPFEEIEAERYEFFESSPYHFDLARRDFFKVLGGGIVVLSIVNEVVAQQRGGGRGRGGEARGPQEIGAWIHIGEDGTVRAFTGKVELGQNIRTSLSQAVAEELHVPTSAVQMVMADTEVVPFDMGTFGSRSTPQMSSQLRRAAAAARELLIDLASAKWSVDRGTLTAGEGRITNPASNTSLSFAELTKGQKLTKAISESARTPPEQWKVLGAPARKTNGRNFATGRHKYASDINLPEMLHGKVLRPASFGATLKSVDTQQAEAVPGVTVVRDGDFVGVTAPHNDTASRALAAIRAEWSSPNQPGGSELYDYLKSHASESRGGSNVGSIKDGLAAAEVKLDRTYSVAYIAHAPLEPRAAVAQWKDGKLTVWTGSQRPFAVRTDLAQTFRVAPENVRVIVPDTGGGYGGKQSSEMALEAARLAKAANRPVKVVWTREEEFTWAYFRPAGVIQVTSGARRDGALTAWEFHNYNSGGSAIQPLYEVPNQHIEFHPSRSPLRQGSYRGLAATANHFAREVHMDELAHELKMDPLEFRLKNLKDPRLRGVLEAAANAFGWGKAQPVEKHGFGLACGFEKGGYIATCAEVAADKDSGRVRVVRAVSAFDCGAVVNPDGLKNQIEGSLMMGLGGALFEQVKFDKGRILNPHFSSYRVPRFSDLPKIEVVLVNRKDVASSGAGETPIVGIAPAISNAIFAASGIRLRSMPLVPDGLKA